MWAGQGAFSKDRAGTFEHFLYMERLLERIGTVELRGTAEHGDPNVYGIWKRRSGPAECGREATMRIGTIEVSEGSGVSIDVPPEAMRGLTALESCAIALLARAALGDSGIPIACSELDSVQGGIGALLDAGSRKEAPRAKGSGGAVDHPAHYNSNPCGVECIDVVRYHDFDTGNAIKYLWRCGLKGEGGRTRLEKEIEDLEKAVWYCND